METWFLSLPSLWNIFKKWKLDSCPYRLCEIYLQNIGYLQKWKENNTRINNKDNQLLELTFFSLLIKEYNRIRTNIIQIF